MAASSERPAGTTALGAGLPRPQPRRPPKRPLRPHRHQRRRRQRRRNKLNTDPFVRSGVSGLAPAFPREAACAPLEARVTMLEPALCQSIAPTSFVIAPLSLGILLARPLLPVVLALVDFLDRRGHVGDETHAIASALALQDPHRLVGLRGLRIALGALRGVAFVALRADLIGDDVGGVFLRRG